ncbi:hypothetical protein [Sorangium cellulosum]|uniref:Uncharacterized protein n=1 Tax=Sorangium cellulosum TaxID=56 RepID=A0A150Q317_SORCE|nr:hypothetical protein [Sorangium cellulosum]KYF62362.1 hypothetical protein BE15_06665 [Sorangium cellulosum]
MGFWPFGGREPANVESASQVVTAAARGENVRGKLTLYFKEPQTQSTADRAAERCAQVAGDLLREIAAQASLLGREAELAASIAARAPRGVPALRAIELAALHVVTDRTTQSRRAGSSPVLVHDPSRSAGGGTPSSRPPPSGPGWGAAPASSRGLGLMSGASPVIDRNAPPSSVPPPKSVRSPPSSGAQRLRGAGAGNGRGSSPGLIGSPPTVIAAALAPLLRDASARLLIGCLRAHELIIVRRVAIDPGAADVLAALLPVSDAPPGELEASRAAELSRWHTTLGSPVISQLRAESCAISAQKARMALGTAGIAPGVVAELVDALCRTAFPGLALSGAQVDRYAEQDLSELAAENVARVLRHPNSKQLRLALGPLLDAVHGDMDAISRLAKASLGSAP